MVTMIMIVTPGSKIMTLVEKSKSYKAKDI